MQIAKNTIFFLLIGLVSSNLYHDTQCSTVADCDHPPFDDTYYEETKQELADEINDVNDYMQMVADQLTNDDVIVVRAMRTVFPTTDMDNTLKSDILELGVKDFSCDHPKDNTSLETVPSTKTAEIDGNISLVDTESREMEQTCFMIEKSPATAKNLTPINVEAEITIP